MPHINWSNARFNRVVWNVLGHNAMIGLARRSGAACASDGALPDLRQSFINSPHMVHTLDALAGTRPLAGGAVGLRKWAGGNLDGRVTPASP
jgi:hypothetical protein